MGIVILKVNSSYLHGPQVTKPWTVCPQLMPEDHEGTRMSSVPLPSAGSVLTTAKMPILWCVGLHVVVGEIV